MFSLILTATILLLVTYETQGVSCKDFLSSKLPCVEIPVCDNDNNHSKVEINKLSNGLGSSTSSSVINLCHDDKSLNIKIFSSGQKYYSNHTFGECNDSIFNSDIAEVFIAPWSKNEPTPHCYSEIDVSPSNKIFESGIYNPNLNHSGVSNYLIECDTSGVSHSTSVGAAHSNEWTENLSIPWTLIDVPFGCPLNKPSQVLTDKIDVYRANFFRVNELVKTDTCTSSTCEYMAWSPTGSNPPAFHEPTKFGYLVLQR